MDILKGYLQQYWKLILLALVLAATNQVFSLLDPLIFRHVIDSYATRFKEYTTGQFVRGVSFLLSPEDPDHGLSILARTRVTMLSLVTSSASAS